METADPRRVWKTLAEKPVVRTPWFQVALPAMIADGEIRAASTSAAVLMLGSSDPRRGAAAR